MTPDRAAVEQLLSNVQARVSSGAWGEVCALLGDRAESREHPELIALLGEAYLRTRAPRDACRWLEGAEAQLARAGDRVSSRRAVNLLGVARFELGEMELAEIAFERAIELGRADGDDLLVARAMNNLGTISNVRGDHDTALARYRMAIPSYQRLGNARGLAETYHNLAITYRDLAQPADAEEHERRAREYAQQASDVRLASMALVGLADLQLQHGDAALAEASALRSANDFARAGDLKGEADALRLAGVAATRLGRYGDARDALGRAANLAARQGYALIEGEALRARAELARLEGDVAAARREAAQALAIFRKLEAAREVAALESWLERL